MDKHSVSEYLNEYINNFNSKYISGGLVGGATSATVDAFITAGNFKGVIEYYFDPPVPPHAGTADEILHLTLKGGIGTSANTSGSFYTIREEFINNQVDIVNRMLTKINEVRTAGTGTGTSPGGFLSEFFNSLYGGSSGQSGGMTGGLRGVANIPTSLTPTATPAEAFSAAFAMAAHVTAPGPVTTTPTPTTAPTTAPTTGTGTGTGTVTTPQSFVDLICETITEPNGARKNTLIDSFTHQKLLTEFNRIESNPAMASNLGAQLEDDISDLSKTGPRSIKQLNTSELALAFSELFTSVNSENTITPFNFVSRKNTGDFQLFISNIRLAILSRF